MRLCQKHRVLILYTLFGCLTVVVNYGVFWIFNALLDSHLSEGYLIAHVISWICSVLFSYCVNKRFVFRAAKNGLHPIQFTSFIFIRVLTEVFVLLAMFFLVTVLTCNEYLMKLLTDTVLVVVNYLFTKHVSFSGIDDKLKAKREPPKENSGGSSDTHAS